MGLDGEGANDEIDPIFLAFDKGGQAMERVLDQIERSKVGARFRAGGWKMGDFIRLYDVLCYCPNNPGGAKSFAARLLPTLPGREREIVAHLMMLPGDMRELMIEKYFGEGG
jgi:hypothetical protein